MAYLLDTNVVIWAVVDDPRLGPASRRVIDTDPSLAVSMVSLWEVIIKTSLGKLKPMPRLPVVLKDRGLDCRPSRTGTWTYWPTCPSSTQIHSIASSSPRPRPRA